MHAQNESVTFQQANIRLTHYALLRQVKYKYLTEWMAAGSEELVPLLAIEAKKGGISGSVAIHGET